MTTLPPFKKKSATCEEALLRCNAGPLSSIAEKHLKQKRESVKLFTESWYRGILIDANCFGVVEQQEKMPAELSHLWLLHNSTNEALPTDAVYRVVPSTGLNFGESIIRSFIAILNCADYEFISDGVWSCESSSHHQQIRALSSFLFACNWTKSNGCYNKGSCFW